MAALTKNATFSAIAESIRLYRHACALLATLGPIRRVQVWVSTRPRAGQLAAAGAKVPAGLNYDLWLGPAPFRPYHESHGHFRWRWWWDFGGGVLADMACHYMDLPHCSGPSRMAAAPCAMRQWIPR